MKLELVLLTIIVSSITERRVEANRDRVECHEFRNFTGANATIYTDTMTFRWDNKLVAEACKVYGTWLFYSRIVYYGKLNAVTGNGVNYYPRERFIVESAYKVPNKSDKSGILLYENSFIKDKRFKFLNSHSYFHKETNISWRFVFKSAVVFGASNWTIESECIGANCKNVLTCFLAPGAGKASFVEEVSNLGRVLSVMPGKCLGKKIAGRPKIPECPCNQGGVVDDANKCEGINGLCNCKSTHTGYDCDWCHKPLVIQSDGTCKAAEDCGCDPRGVDNDYSCKPSNSKNGKCNCRRHAKGDKCDQCDPWAVFRRNICQLCNCETLKVNTSKYCVEHTGKCNCLKQFAGDKCERCATNYTQFRTSCFSVLQMNITDQLKIYCDAASPSKSKVLALVKDLKTQGMMDSLPYAWYLLTWGWITASKAACNALKAIR